MAEARCREAWNRASAVMALLANVHRGSRSEKVFRPSGFDPYMAKRKTGVPLPAQGLGILKGVFVESAGRRMAPWRANPFDIADFLMYTVARS
jgi:hypothetical protein